MSNPWIERHVDAETEFQEGNSRLARRLVMNEYAGAPEPMPCPCGGQMHFRATVGAMQCPDCRQLAHGNGDLIGGRFANENVADLPELLRQEREDGQEYMAEQRAGNLHGRNVL